MWAYRTEILRIRRTTPAEVEALRSLLVSAGQDRWKLEFLVPLGSDYYLLIFVSPKCPCR